MRYPLSLIWLQKQFLSVLRRLRISDQTFLILLAVIVGLVVGGGSFLFEKMLEFSNAFFWEILPKWLGENKLWIVLTPCLGAFLLVPFILLFPVDATKDGVPATMEAVALN
ncbi:MAG: hypothetical protein GX433_17460, partial [Deltaproteobacteria bacterium]|nr:hypothetical protein [Deltaproteobacteria bacterium]